MQHKDIADGERHELKGASTAIVGSVPVSNGAGATNFQKIGALSLSGSIPTTIEDRIIATDGSGGFKALQPQTFGSFELSAPTADLPNPALPSQPKYRYGASFAYINPTGLNMTNGVLSVNATGNYVISAGGYTYTPGVDVTPPSSKVFFSNLYDYQTGVLVSAARSVPHGIFLEASKQYVLDQAGDMSTIVCTIEKVGV